MDQRQAKSTKNSKQQVRKNRPELDLSTLVYGKVPPQAQQLEVAVLGALLMQGQAIDVVQELLKPETFYLEAHQRIYSAMLSLQAKGSPIDIFTVIEQLTKTEELELIGGAYYVTKLTNGV